MCLVDARAHAGGAGRACDDDSTENQGEEGYATEPYVCTHPENSNRAFMLGSEAGVPRRLRCITAVICVGGRTYIKRICPDHARQLIQGGLRTTDTFVRRPLVHLIGLNPTRWGDFPDWDDADRDVCHEMMARVNDIGKGVLTEYAYLSYWAHHPLTPWRISDVKYPGLWVGQSDLSDRNFVQLKRVYMWPSSVSFGQHKVLAKLTKQYGARFIDWAYPTGSRALRAREKIDAVDAIRIAEKIMDQQSIARVMYYSLGLGGQTLCRMLLFAVLAPRGLKILDRLYELGCFTGDVAETITRLKKVHIACRQCDSALPIGRQFASYSVDHVLYCNMLIGRVPDTDDDLSEIAVRTRARPARELDQDVYDESLSLLRELLSTVVQPGSIPSLGPSEAVWKAFLAELTTGSSSVALPEVLKNAGIYSWTKAKAAILSSYKQILARAQRPGLRGTAIVKYEPGGRNRPLLPSDDCDWLRWTILLMWVENKLWRVVSASPMKWDAADWVSFGISNRLATAAGAWLTASDFDDYNQLHSNELMAAMALEIGDKLAQASGDTQYNLLAQRIADGIMDSKLKMPGGTVHTKYGLWSGWRSTSFINTLLNPIYNRLRSAHQGQWPLCSVFQGDDSIDIWSDKDAAIACLNNLDADGFYAQHAKQMVSQRRLEFLRVMWRDGLWGKGSLLRAISNSVSADLQSSEMCLTLTLDWLEDFLRRVKRRGAVITRTLRGAFRAVVSRKIGCFATYRDKHAQLAKKQSRVMLSMLGETRGNPVRMAVGPRPSFIPADCWCKVQDEVNMRYIASQTRVDDYAISKPSARLAKLPTYLTGSERLQAIYVDPSAALASEVLARVLGPLNASILARELLVKNLPTAELLHLAKIGTSEYVTLCALDRTEWLKCARNLHTEDHVYVVMN